MKNEFAKAKADWARDRKRLVSDHENTLGSHQKESEIEREAELRAQKEKIEKQWRKKSDDREKVLEERLNEIDKEMNDMRQRHSEDIKLERERTENRVKENIRQELKAELTQEMQSEFEAELLKTQSLHKAELQEIKRQYEEMLQSERNNHMPKQVEVEEAEVQVSAVNITQTSNVLRGSPLSQTDRGQATSPRSTATNPLPSSARTCNCSEL